MLYDAIKIQNDLQYTSVVSFLHRAVSANLLLPLLPSPRGH